MATKSTRGTGVNTNKTEKPQTTRKTTKNTTTPRGNVTITKTQMQQQAKKEADEKRRKMAEATAKTTTTQVRTTKMAAAAATAKATATTQVKTTKPAPKATTTQIRAAKIATAAAAATAKTTTTQRVKTQKMEMATQKNNNNNNNNMRKPNAVLDTYHNVTVTSPKKKAQIEKAQLVDGNEMAAKRIRTSTRTLKPEEIVILKPQAEKEERASVKEPVAFEVKFDNDARMQNETEDDKYSDDFDSYESDFEETADSSSALEEEEQENEEKEQEDENEDDEEQDSNSNSISAEETSEDDDDDDDKELQQNENMEHSDSDNDDDDDDDDIEDDSEPTQNPITVIQRDKLENERKLDSGHYDMHGGQQRQPRLAALSAQSTQQQFDSFDTFSMANSEQLDSGISSYGNDAGMPKVLEKQHDDNSFYDGYAHFHTKPYMSKRGLELSKKLQFDCLNFELFELKPLSYEDYMQSYGTLNTCQMAVQTQQQQLTCECQTDEIEWRSVWTQHPPLYDLKTVQQHIAGGGVLGLQNCCGEEVEAAESVAAVNKELEPCAASLSQLNEHHQAESKRILQRQMEQRNSKQIHQERLSNFLHNAELQMSAILNESLNLKLSTDSAQGESSGINTAYITLEAGFLNALRVRRIFSNPRHQLVITVHECLPGQDVYRDDFANLLMIWSTACWSKPLRLLSTWEEVCRAEISNDCADIVICGLRDGSVALWDLRETYTYCAKLDGQLPHFAATQSIVPTLAENRAKSDTVMLDLGAVVDVRSFRLSKNLLKTSYKNIQFATLNDSGILAVWTLIETANSDLQHQDFHMEKRVKPFSGTKFEYSSPWARVKLIQSAICELRVYLEQRLLKTQNQYDKTKALFQKNIYNDELLRELNETQTVANALQGQGLQGLRFTSIDTSCDRIYVCANRNFVLACPKSLNPTRFARIAINVTGFLFPTALCVLSNEDYLAVGLSNGSVMILNCNQKISMLKHSSKRITSAANTPPTQDLSNDFKLDTSKSCAIQNIILSERCATNDYTVGASYEESRPTTAACIEMLQNPKRSFELRVYDQQLLLSGTGLRKHLVKSLMLSSDGWRLYVLANGSVRVYDFFTDRETDLVTNEKNIEDISVVCNSTTAQHLVLFNKEKNTVQLHNLSI